MPCITFVKRQYYTEQNESKRKSIKKSRKSDIFWHCHLYFSFIIKELLLRVLCSGIQRHLSKPQSDNQDKNWKKRNNRENFTVTTALSYTHGVNEFMFTCNHYKWFYLSIDARYDNLSAQPCVLCYRTDQIIQNKHWTIIFQSTYQIGKVSLNVSLNLTIIYIFTKRDDVNLCAYALIRFNVCNLDNKIFRWWFMRVIKVAPLQKKMHKPR